MLGRIQPALKEFLARETTAGFMLFGAAILALVASNSVLAPQYSGFLQTPVEIRVGALQIAKSLLLWINDGLMAVFFFLIGLEVKREVLAGDLSTIRSAALPAIAAIGGMAIPALFFIGINWNSPENLAGWAIPAATDIAFALGIVAILGPRVPVSFKILLLAIAIIDDIGAIAIIALFYTGELSTAALALAAIGVLALAALNRLGVSRVAPYVLVGIFVWICVLKSGVHATLAGVLVAIAVPFTRAGGGKSPLKHLEHILHPWVAFMVLPLFAFANAGVQFAGVQLNDFLTPLPLGIVMGLVIGKQFGVFGFAVVAIKLKIVSKPSDLSYFHVYGLACITGVGFTMSLFIGTLAFVDPGQIDAVKIGVLAGSLLSSLMGLLILRFAALPPSTIEPAM